MPPMLFDTTATIDTIVQAVNGMAASVQSGCLSAIDGILPVVAPITAAIVVANLGRKVVVRFAR